MKLIQSSLGCSLLVLSLSAFANNHIDSISASDDGKNLTFTMKGNFSKGSHYWFAIDTDNNTATGYSKGNIKGADYLVQKNGLYQYPKNAKGWKWEKVTGKVMVTNTSGQVQILVPMSRIKAKHSIRYIAVVSSRDWSSNTVYPQMTKYQIATSKIQSLHAQHDNKNLTLQMKGSFISGSHNWFAIDADNNPSTGYSRGKIRGAEYLVQKNGLYQYPKDAKGWKWEKVSTHVTLTSDSKGSITHIPRNLIKTKNTIRYIAVVSDKNWSNNVVYPEMVKYQLAHSGLLIGDDRLGIELERHEQGMGIKNIKINTNNVLKSSSPLFSLKIRLLMNGHDSDLSSLKGWSNVKITNSGSDAEVIFSQPVNKNLPANLTVTATLKVKDTKSYWDLQVTGLGNKYSLMDTTFPELNIKADGSDHFFAPFRFGKIFDNPGAGMDDFKQVYPMGWGATMQYMAYYNNRYGIYFGSHDPKASLKTFNAYADNGGIKVKIETPAPNQTLAANDWDFPGEFELNAYQGDWFDAALLYKDWVYRKADYRPPVKITARARKLGDISVWANQNVSDDLKGGNTREDLERSLSIMKERIGNDITLGTYWYSAYDHPEYGGRYFNEFNMPKFYPSSETSYLVDKLAQKGASTMVYSNAYLYDKNIENPDVTVPAFSDVEKSACKSANGSIYEQTWESHSFARMCPTQQQWQNILANVHEKHLVPLDAKGVFLDQVTAATPVRCYDRNHGHPLGGGHYWRDGNKALVNKIRAKYPEGTFFLSESVNDSLMDVLDGYETIIGRYLMQNQVPAMQVVYGGKVQFIGPKPGASYAGSKDFYGISAYAFSLGSTPGYFYPHLTDDRHARDYIRMLAKLRTKLKQYISFGEMKRPLKIDGIIPQITVKRNDGAVTIPAIQKGVWLSEDKRSIAIVFINAQTPGNDPVTFSFDFNGKQYGLSGNLSVKEVKANGETTLGGSGNHFYREVSLGAADSVAFILTRH